MKSIIKYKHTKHPTKKGKAYIHINLKRGWVKTRIVPIREARILIRDAERADRNNNGLVTA